MICYYEGPLKIFCTSQFDNFSSPCLSFKLQNILAVLIFKFLAINYLSTKYKFSELQTALFQKNRREFKLYGSKLLQNIR